MKTLISILLLTVNLSLFSQEVKISKVIMDLETKLPLENATINNGFEFTSSNSEGHFIFISKKDSIKIDLLGYKSFYRKIDEIKNRDTIFLTPIIINLTEIVVKDLNDVMTNIFGNIINTTPNYNYNEKFFLRTILKKNDSIIKFQDIIGLIERKKTFTSKKDSRKNIKVEVLNMRKLGVLKKSKNVEFSFFTFSELFFRATAIYANPSLHNFKNKEYLNEKRQKIYFTPKKPYSNNSFRGYYVIDSEKKSIIETDLKNSFPSHFKEKRGFKWRTISSKSNIKFNYNYIDKKHHISQVLLCYELEVITPKQKKNIYRVEYNLFTTENFIRKKIKKNINSNKIIFDINIDYDKLFWENQNHLALDRKLMLFVKKLDKKRKGKYEIITNMKE